MPVISEHQNLGNHQTVARTSPSIPPYLFLSLAILSILGIRISRRNQKSYQLLGASDSGFEKCRTLSARTMQEQSSSALPDKPYLPDLENVSSGGVEGRVPPTSSTPPEASEKESSSSRSSSSPHQNVSNESLLSSVHFIPSHQPRGSQSSGSRPHSFHHRLGSLPSVTTSLLGPEPPSPTIAMSTVPLDIRTQIPYQPELPSQNYGADENPPYLSEYTQNEIRFVPSPTEYTSFEALYSKIQPPIYHSPNPSSYTSITSDPEASSSGTRQTAFSAAEGNLDYRQDPTVPRRRSYIKTLSNGSEMSGEITISGINGEGIGANPGPGVGGQQWRRHTRVFGGGVCMACEENEIRRMTS